MELQEQASVYRVEGEVGRFSFGLYAAVDATGERVCRGEVYFPARQPREWHKTEGFREEAVCLEASRRSYRDNTAHLNRYRRQWAGGTPVTTRRDNAQQEGARVLNFLERHSQTVLQEHGFDGQGQPAETRMAQATRGMDRRLEAQVVEEQLADVVQAMAQRGFSPAEIAAARHRAAGAVYEDSAHCANVCLDDVEVKKHKVHRKRAASPMGETVVADRDPSDVARGAGKARPKVTNTVARIEQGAKRFTLSGGSLGQVLRFVLAFLLYNDLLSGRLHVFTDGYHSLQNTIVAFFAWHPRVWLVLDWYHLVKKFKEDLSRACRGRVLRNRHLGPLVRFLWYGMVSEARQYLDTIPTADLKDNASIERLQKYLERNEGAIPC